MFDDIDNQIKSAKDILKKSQKTTFKILIILKTIQILKSKKSKDLKI